MISYARVGNCRSSIALAMYHRHLLWS